MTHRNWGGPRTPGPGKSLGRPKLPPSERTSARQISLPPACWAWLEAAAEGGSVSAVIRALVEEQ